MTFSEIESSHPMAGNADNPFDFFKTLQEEALRLFEYAIQTTCEKLDQIADEAKVKMEDLCRRIEGARKNVEAQLTRIHEHAIEMIGNLVKESETYIRNIWDNTRLKIITFVDALVNMVDPEKIARKAEEITNYMSNKINEFNQRVKEHANAIIILQEQFFENLRKRLETTTEQDT